MRLIHCVVCRVGGNCCLKFARCVSKPRNPGLCRDVWKFDTRAYSWRLVSSDGPSARAYHVAAWDPTNLDLWIHGGFDGVARRDLWRFHTQTSTWDLLQDNNGPIRRYNHVAGFDAVSKSFWVHGGYEGSTLQDLWRFDITTTTTSITSSSSTLTSSTLTSTSTTLTNTRTSTTRSTTSSRSFTTSTISASSTTSSSLTVSTTSSSSSSSSSSISSSSTSSTSSWSSSSTLSSSRSTTISSSTSTSRTRSTSKTSTSVSTSLSSTITRSSITITSSSRTTFTTSSFTNTSITFTSSTETTSSSTLSTVTHSTSTSSTSTSSSATQTRTSTSSSTQTFSTSTSSTATTTTTTVEDLTVVLVLSPTLGVLILGLLALIACWAQKHCSCRRVLVMPMPATTPPQWWHPPPPQWWPPSPPPAPPAPPMALPLKFYRNTERLRSPQTCLAKSAPRLPYLRLVLPDLHQVAEHEGPHVEITSPTSPKLVIDIKSDAAVVKTPTSRVQICLVPELPERQNCFQCKVAAPRLPGDTMIAPVLDPAPSSRGITRPFLTMPAQEMQVALGPQAELPHNKGVATATLALKAPDLCECPRRNVELCSVPAQIHTVTTVPHPPVSEGPSISVRHECDRVVPINPRWSVPETMVAPVLEVPTSCPSKASCASTVVPLTDVQPPQALYCKEPLAVSSEPSTTCYLNVLFAKEQRLIDRTSSLVEVLSYVDSACQRVPPRPADEGIALTRPQGSARPVTRKPRQPFVVPPAPILETPSATPFLLGLGIWESVSSASHQAQLEQLDEPCQMCEACPKRARPRRPPFRPWEGM